MPAAPPKRALASKEASLFKELLNFYETRQLKKGLKTADQILKKSPEHGETLCMKGLILTHMGKREEGIDLVKKGIRLDLTSHIVWHVFGLIQKGEKHYEEALKSYMQALRFDKDNMNILRDTANLQAQLRIYDGLVDTRHAILKLRPAMRQHWIAMAVAYHLDGNLVEALKVLENYETVLKEVPDYNTEHSELMLYHVRLLEDMGELSQALSVLDSNARSRVIVDRIAIMEFRARLLSKLGPSDTSKEAWKSLIEQNPDYREYYDGYLKNEGVDLRALTDSTRARALEILDDFSNRIPRASVPRRMALDVSQDGGFSERAEVYITSALAKGVPSLFVDLKPLYADPHKQKAIGHIAESIYTHLKPHHPTPAPPSGSSEPPTTYLWTLYFLAQHDSFLKRYQHALSFISTAIEHTPTLPELYACRARILKRAGDPPGAARALCEARALDGQDRFLNTKCAKYLLRAGLIDEANELLGRFTKKDAPSPATDLEDMQSLLYLTESAAAYERNGQCGMALKRYVAVRKTFDEYEDDQYDFHGYSMRKSNLNVYHDLVAWEDRAWSHPAYIMAAVAAARIFVRVHDDPSILSANSAAGMTDAEKKAKKKAKKAAQKVQEDPKKAAPATNANEDKGLEPPPPKDDDPDGSKLLASSDPLGQAAKWLAPLTTLRVRETHVWLAAYDVAVRRHKWLQAVRALNFVHFIDKDHPELHVRIVDLKKTLSSLPAQPLAPVGPALSVALSKLIPDEVSVEHFSAQLLQHHPNSPQAVLAAARMRRRLEAPREGVEDVLFGMFHHGVALDLPTAKDGLTLLIDLKSPRADEFRLACDHKFHLATVFKTPEEQTSLRRTVHVEDTVAENGDASELVG